MGLIIDIFASIASMLLSFVYFAITTTALVAATPLFVLFSPILVPAGVATVLAAGGDNNTSVTIVLKIVTKIYKLATGKEPPARLQRILKRAMAAANGGQPKANGAKSPASPPASPPAGKASPPAGGAPTLNLIGKKEKERKEDKKHKGKKDKKSKGRREKEHKGKKDKKSRGKKDKE